MAVNRRVNLYSTELGNDDASINQLSAIASVVEAEDVCIHFKVEGLPNGTLYLDISNALTTDANGDPDLWEEFDSILFAGPGTQMWLDKSIPYTHCRLRWEQTGGTGTLAAVLTSKGES